MERVAALLDNGIESIEEAHEEAPFGTALMIEDLLEEARSIRSRVRNISESENDS